MPMDSVHFGYATLSVGDRKAISAAPNLAHSQCLDAEFKDSVGSGTLSARAYFNTDYMFRRHSTLRPYKAGLTHRAHHSHLHGGSYREYWCKPNEGIQNLAVTNIGYRDNRTYTGQNQRRSWSGTMETGVMPAAVSRFVVQRENMTLAINPPNVDPLADWPYMPLSEVDIPGSQLGPIFKHPTGRSAWFNEVGQASFSQGSYRLSGTFQPPETQLNHYGYRVYVAKSGGTGKIQTPPGQQTQGSVGTAGALDFFSSRSGHAAVFDIRRGRLVVFGGEDGGGRKQDIWEWDGVRWLDRTPTGTKPSARRDHVLVYDWIRARVVLFGGFDGALSQETWEWDGDAGTWTNLTPVGTKPSARRLSAAVFDTVQQRTLLFGGYDGVSDLQDSWEWDGTAWVDRTPGGTKPSARSSAALAYDWRLGRAVLFGGLATGVPSAETWEWESALRTWTQRTPVAAPSARHLSGVGYDTRRERAVLFGGATDGAGTVFSAETWEWDGYAKTWTLRSPGTSPSARKATAAAYDTGTRRFWLVGGDDGVLKHDTWRWEGDAGTWTQAAETANNRFVDVSAGGYFQVGVHDAAGSFFYVSVRGAGNAVNNGTFKIRSVIDVNTVELDNADIRQPFTSESGLSWTLRQGPVGEYFWQRRPYTMGSSWSQGAYAGDTYATSNGLAQMAGSLQGAQHYRDFAARTVYDGYAFWWAVYNRSTSGDPRAGLIRWLHNSPTPYDGVYLDGDITGGMPTGISSWRDINRDALKKLWVCWEACTSSSARLVRINPAPGGATANPAVEVLVSKQSSKASADGLTSSAPRGVTCDDSGIYATRRVWVMAGSDVVAKGGTVGTGGISYSDDDGTTWKRVHRFPQLTGRVTLTNGSADVTGSGTDFVAEGIAAGVLVRFENETTVYTVSAAPAPTATTFTLTGTYSGTGTALTGTVSTAIGSRVVTGVGTSFTTQLVAGDWVRIANEEPLEVEEVVSNTSLVLRQPMQYPHGGQSIVRDPLPYLIPSGTADVTNGLTSVNGTGTSFDTELAPGDWVRFGRDDRSYEVVSRTATAMVLATPYEGTTATVPYMRGGLRDFEGRLFFTNSWPTATGADDSYPSFGCGAPLDFDSRGNLYWVSEPYDRTEPTAGRPWEMRVCRWNPSRGRADSFAELSIRPTTGLNRPSHGAFRTLRVQRMADGRSSLFRDTLWISGMGRYKEDGIDRANPDVLGWLRVPAEAFGGAQAGRYVVTTSGGFPNGVTTPNSEGYQKQGGLWLERTTGKLALVSQRADRQMNVIMAGPSQGNLTDLGGNTMWRNSGPAASWFNAEFDPDGMGILMAASPGDRNNSAPEGGHGGWVYPFWMDKLWNGTAWVNGIAGPDAADLLFRGPGQLHNNLAVGLGLRRLHEDEQPISDGLMLSFVQAGGAVQQQDEFLIDETATAVAYLGAGKDNTQQMTLGYEHYIAPTVLRTLTEPVRDVRNPWTSDFGVDGAQSVPGNGNTLTLGAGMPKWWRGVAEPFEEVFDNRTNLNTDPNPLFRSQFVNTTSQDVNIGLLQGMPALVNALRLPDEVEIPADLSLDMSTGASPARVVATSVSRLFTTADVGKSVIIEGAGGASPHVDNGQAVILSIGTDPATPLASSFSAVTDKVFSAALTGLRWKLRSIPIVGSAVWNWYLGPSAAVANHFINYELYSSQDYGQTWQLVKFYRDPNLPVVPVGGPDTQRSTGVSFDVVGGHRGGVQANPDSATYGRITFDLSDLPTNVRRRQYWKIHQVYASNYGNISFQFGGMLLLDTAGVPLGVPANNRVADVTDPLFYGCRYVFHALVQAQGTQATAQAVATNAYGFTDTVTLGGGANLYEQSGTGNAVLFGPGAQAGQFQSAGAAFDALSVGKFLRISGSTTAANNKFALITAVLSPVLVQTDQGWTAESSLPGTSWQILSVRDGDYLRLDSSTRLVVHNRPLNDVHFKILDIPASATVKLVQQEIPVTGPAYPVPWDIVRFLTISNGRFEASFLTSGKVYASQQHGYFHFSDALELQQLFTDSPANNAFTEDDGDGDGRTNTVTISHTLTGALATAAAGDVLELVEGGINAGLGRRNLIVAARTPITGAVPGDSALWLKADVGITLNGSNVAAWADQSANAFSAVQGTAGSQPLLVVASQNGLDVVRFDGVDDFLSVAHNVALDLTGGFHLFVLMRTITPPQANDALLVKGNTAWRLQFASASVQRLGTTGLSNVDEDGRVNVADNSWHILEGSFSGTTAKNLRSDGPRENFHAVTGTLGTNTDAVSIGENLGAGATGRFFNGDVAEIIVFPRQLTGTERKEVQAYLAGKWAVIGSGVTDLKLTYDELPTDLERVNTTPGLAWKVLRNRGLKHRVLRHVVATRSTT